jgi:hypothetical protein
MKTYTFMGTTNLDALDLFDQLSLFKHFETSIDDILMQSGRRLQPASPHA